MIILSRRNLYLVPGLLLVFSTLFIPINYRVLKAVLLFFTIAVSFSGFFVFNKGKIDYKILFLLILNCSYNLFSIIYGYLNGNPGAFSVASVYFFWPITYIIIYSTINDVDIFEKIFKAIFWATVAIELYCVYFILNALGYIPPSLFFELDLDSAIGLYSGFVEFRILSLSSLIFSLPLLLTTLIIWPKEEELPVKKILIILTLILGILLVIASARKGLLISILATPFIAFFFNRFQSKGKLNLNRIFFFSLLSLIVLIPILYFVLTGLFGFKLDAFMSDFTEGFNFSAYSGESSYARRQQFFALIEGWKNNIAFGSGMGGVASVIRSHEQPWAYELAYLSLLFHIGIVGVVIYALSYIWVLVQNILIIKEGGKLSNYAVIYMSSTVAFLIANATNPYMEKFDYLWIFFLPIAVINFKKTNTVKLKETNGATV